MRITTTGCPSRKDTPHFFLVPLPNVALFHSHLLWNSSPPRIGTRSIRSHVARCTALWAGKCEISFSQFWTWRYSLHAIIVCRCVIVIRANVCTIATEVHINIKSPPHVIDLDVLTSGLILSLGNSWSLHFDMETSFVVLTPDRNSCADSSTACFESLNKTLILTVPPCCDIACVHRDPVTITAGLAVVWHHVSMRVLFGSPQCHFASCTGEVPMTFFWRSSPWMSSWGTSYLLLLRCTTFDFELKACMDDSSFIIQGNNAFAVIVLPQIWHARPSCSRDAVLSPRHILSLWESPICDVWNRSSTSCGPDYSHWLLSNFPTSCQVETTKLRHCSSVSAGAALPVNIKHTTPNANDFANPRHARHTR